MKTIKAVENRRRRWWRLLQIVTTFGRNPACDHLNCI